MITLEEALARVPHWQNARELQTSFLAGGITNQNYRVDADGHSSVLRLTGANTDLLGIDRQTEQAATRAAAALGIGPEVEYFIEPEGCLVTRFIRGRPIPPAAMRSTEVIRLVAGVLRRFHGSGSIPGYFSPFRVVEAYQRLALERDRARDVGERQASPFPANFDHLLAQMRAVERAMQVAPSLCPCHNDLLNENFLIEDDTGRIRILDWEYAGMGDPHFDLGNLAAQHTFGDEQDEALLISYWGALTPEHWARHKLMRCMSDFREAMWGVAQQSLSSLDFDFRGYADQYFARLSAGFDDPRCVGWIATLGG